MNRHQTEAARELTDLILTTFRLNGALLQTGDALVQDLALTSARWQVIGAVALEGRPLTVAQVGRRMGLTRQAVQRVVNDLVADEMIALHDNPDHKRAKLVALTVQGRSAYAEAERRQVAWSTALAEGLDPKVIRAATTLMQTVLERLYQASEASVVQRPD